MGEAEGRSPIAFEDTGAYRLLLGTSNEELMSFYSETVEPLVAYDDSMKPTRVATVEAYLDSDANVPATAKQMFTHRHTIRYRLERIRDLSGHDATATEGRERLGLGIKAMRVLGIASPRAAPKNEPARATHPIRSRPVPAPDSGRCRRFPANRRGRKPAAPTRVEAVNPAWRQLGLREDLRAGCG